MAKKSKQPSNKITLLEIKKRNHEILKEAGLLKDNTAQKFYDMGDPAVIKAWVEGRGGNMEDYKKGPKVHSLITALYYAAGMAPDKISGKPDQKYKFLLRFMNGGTKDRKLSVEEIKAMESLTIGQIIKILLPW